MLSILILGVIVLILVVAVLAMCAYIVDIDSRSEGRRAELAERNQAYRDLLDNYAILKARYLVLVDVISNEEDDDE